MNESETTSRTSSGIFPSLRSAVWWDPRRSLGARLALFLLPLVVLPALFYGHSSNVLWGRARTDITEVLTRELTDRERASLRQAADRRTGEMDEEISAVTSVGREATSAVLAALHAGPSPELPAEPLVDVPGGPIRTADRSGSAAMISRSAGVTPATLRDLAVTRRLEPSFSQLVVGLPSVSALFVVTSSGVLRAVPWCDLSRLVEAGGMSADFGPRAAATTERDVLWTPVYDDLYAHRGRIVSAVFPVRERDGSLAAEVGVDWVYGELFARLPEARRHGEVEVVWGADGRQLFQMPDGSLDAHTVRQLGDAVKGLHAGEHEVSLREEPVLAAVRTLPSAGWTYARIVPLSALREAVRLQLAPVFDAASASRRRLQLVYLGLLLLIGGPMVAVARRSTAPIRGLARYADAITRREDPGPVPGTGRRDELGRLARALEDLERRIRRRLRSMEGLHDLARTGAVMTRPDETFARLSRRIGELVGATKAFFALWDAESRALVFTPPGYGIADDVLRSVRIGLDEHSLTLLAYRTGETYVSNEVGSDPRVARALAERTGVRTNAVMCPLRTEAGSLGVLVVCDKPEPFDAEDQAAIQIYADEAALLLRNARLYEELQKSFERLRDAHRNRDYFLQNINHELRTPLTAILGWSEVLAEDEPDQKTVATAVEQIRRSAQFLLTLISDLLDLSRFEEGRTQLDRAPADVGTLVREAIDPVAVMAEAKGIRIVVTAPEAGRVSARLDALRTRQVLWNLVHNAVKFTPKGGQIEVVATRDASGVTFTIADDGVGVDPKDLPFIFERFRQGDGSATRAYRGTGIGLALAKAYVELHGGRIEAENRPVRGSMFRVFLPDPLVDSTGSLPRPALKI